MLKIIDLLNKIAKGEDVPKYIEYYNRGNNKREIMICCKENIIYKLDQLIIGLNDEVEIIEEKVTQIEKISSISVPTINNDREKNIENVTKTLEKYWFTINELIDVINDMRDKE